MWMPPFRLRHVLTLGLLGALVAWVYPRGRAAWEVHDLAGKTADYASCMVGPTGPELIRDNRAEFQRLVRRRLVSAAPEEAPFNRCAHLAGIVAGTADTERKHTARAAQFVEYGLDPAPQVALSLTALALDLSPLIDRTKRAWPFVRGGFARLVKTSLGAREAVHPVPPARPGVGRGLPSDRALPRRVFRAPDGLLLTLGADANRVAYASSDDGVTFRPARPPADDAGRGECGGKDPERGFGVSSREDGSLLVTSFGPNREPSTVTAIVGEHVLHAMSCDDQALVVAAQAEGKALALVLCAHERTCVPLRIPERAPFTSFTAESFDLARVASATVLAVERRGIVRVISTRDDGRTWTPPTVAFDAADTAVRADITLPTRLLAAGSRLYLYGAARRGNESYPLLVSDDQGASFRAPGAVEPAPTPAAVARSARAVP
jgi:hypothetical protein